MIRKIASMLLVLLSIIMLFGCHTVKGLGQDIESGGKALERSSGK